MVGSAEERGRGCDSYCCVAVIKHHHQDNLAKEEFIWAHSFRGARVCHGGKAWRKEQKVEGPHLQMQA